MFAILLFSPILLIKSHASIYRVKQDFSYKSLFEKSVFETVKEPKTSKYVNLEVLVIILLEVTQDTKSASLCEAILDKIYLELEKARRFYWVNTYCSLNLNFSYIITDAPVKFSGWWLPPNSISTYVKSALQKVEAETGDKIDIVVMIQGDEPMLFPEMIDEAVQPLLKDKNVLVSNIMAPLKTIKEHSVLDRSFFLVIPEIQHINLDVQVGVCEQQLRALNLKTKRLNDEELTQTLISFFNDTTNHHSNSSI